MAIFLPTGIIEAAKPDEGQDTQPATPRSRTFSDTLGDWGGWAGNGILGGVETALGVLGRPGAAVRGAALAGQAPQDASPEYNLGLFKVRGFNPETIGAMGRGAFQGLLHPEQVGPSTDLPLVRNLPEGPFRTALGVTTATLSDPMSAIVGPEVALSGALGAEAARSGVNAALPDRTPAGVRRAADLAAGVVGGTAGMSAAGALSSRISPEAPIKPEPPPRTTTAGSLFGLPDESQPGLSRFDEMLNTVKSTVGIGTPEDATATPIMRARQRAQSVVDSQSARMGAIADAVQGAFETDKSGRISSLPGAPTIQDLAAAYDDYRPFLSQRQSAAMDRLRSEVAPFAKALTEQGIEINQRNDVKPGGFYLPRGRADLEGADTPAKVSAGRGMAGGKKGFERGAVFDSMSQGIDAGYEYAPFRDALQSYARDAGTRAIDQWAVGQLKASGEGTTPKEWVTQQNPGLAGRKAALDAELQRLRGLKNALSDRTHEAIDRFLHDPSFDSVDDLRAALPETVRRGASAGADFAALRDSLASVKQQIADIRPEWNKAIERARLQRDRSGIGFSGLQGTSFPDEVANAANKYLNAERPATGKAASTLNAVTAFNGLMRGIKASADISFTGIQGLLGAVQHPREYGRAMVVAFKSMGDPAAVGKFITEFDDAARAAGRPDSAAWNAVGNRLGGTDTEFAIGRGLQRVGPAIQNAPIIKQSNRSFGAFGDVLRLGASDALYQARANAGKAVGAAEMADIARFSNLMTGYSGRVLGGDAAQLVQFAPRFFTSQLDLVGAALGDRGIVGSQARTSMAKLIGYGTLMTVAANSARGYDTDFKPESPNFMRIRNVGGTDVSLFGPWDSLVRGLVSTAHGDVSYFARSKASPAVSMAWDYLSGKDFVGNDTRHGWAPDPEWALRQLLPFSLSDAGRAPLAAIAIGATGVKATPLSPTDRVQMHQWDEMSGMEQFKAIHPQAWQAIVEQAPDEVKKEFAGTSTYYDWYQKQVATLTPLVAAEARAKGYPDASVNGVVQRAIQNMPVYKAYHRAIDHYETEWIQKNPQDALREWKRQSQLPWGQQTWMPTRAQQALIAKGAGR